MRSIPVAAFAAALTFAASGALAQNFFERLFGIAPSRPEPPPAAAPGPSPGPSGGSDEPAKPRAAPPPAQARPTAVRVPNEDQILGRDLKQNGTNGGLRLDRTARGDLRAKLTLVGRRSAGSVETCSVAFGGTEGVALVSQGKPEGASRYQLQSPECPLQIDILEEAVLVKGSSEICVFPTASCQADPSGLWGPEPAKLLGRTREYEQARASADKAVRDNYKVMVQRAGGAQAVRPIVAEQAAFSSDREMVCRSYAREGTHSFCNSRVTEARALSLATRLGITSVAANAPIETRIRRQRNDAMGLPTSETLTQRPGITPPVEEE